MDTVSVDDLSTSRDSALLSLFASGSTCCLLVSGDSTIEFEISLSFELASFSDDSFDCCVTALLEPSLSTCSSLFSGCSLLGFTFSLSSGSILLSVVSSKFCSSVASSLLLFVSVLTFSSFSVVSSFVFSVVTSSVVSSTVVLSFLSSWTCSLFKFSVLFICDSSSSTS
ncbi:hypothetical protein [Staphylococcus shinii]|uniref:hypothetical protein n=1 Tax=Staphylococcus shinii TaxID=2912228 RepID=UPI003F556D5C